MSATATAGRHARRLGRRAIAQVARLSIVPVAALLALGCSNAGTSSAPPDPNAPGPFGVGTTTRQFVRPSSTTGEPRQLDTVIWYPAPADATGAPFHGGVQDARVADGGPFPLLVFSHGSCGIPWQSTFLMTRLASYGFVVAAPPHPGNTVFDRATPDPCLNPVNLVDPYRNRPADIEFTIGEMIDLAAGDALFAGAIDASRIGIFGHSFGGQTVVRVAAEDARVGAMLALAPGSAAIVLPQADKIAVPSMVQGGDQDTLAPFAQNAQPVYDHLRAPRFLVEILDTGHFAFADNCLAPTGTTYPDCAAGTLTQDEAHALVLRFAVPFFEVYVAGDARWQPLLDPASDTTGVVYTTDF